MWPTGLSDHPVPVTTVLLARRFAIRRPAPNVPRTMSIHCSAVGLSRVTPRATNDATAGVIAGMNDAVTKPRMRAA